MKNAFTNDFFINFSTFITSMHPSTENPSTVVLGRATILMHKIKPNALTLHYCIITLINQSINILLKAEASAICTES